MKKWFKIGSFLLLFTLLTAEDCSYGTAELSYEERQTAMFNRIESEFEKEQLGEQDLKAFENRSLQMFSDLIDYVNVLADTSLSNEFRNQSQEMLSDLFVTENELDSFLGIYNLNKDENDSRINFKGGNPVTFKIISCAVFDHLSLQSDLSYSGSIKFNISANVPGFVWQENLLEIQLQKIPKQFGEETLEVWKVFFGTIK